MFGPVAEQSTAALWVRSPQGTIVVRRTDIYSSSGCLCMLHMFVNAPTTHDLLVDESYKKKAFAPYRNV